jgi:hypothetical protein
MSHTTFVGKRFKSYSADRLTRSLARPRAPVIQQVGASAPSRMIIQTKHDSRDAALPMLGGIGMHHAVGGTDECVAGGVLSGVITFIATKG